MLALVWVPDGDDKGGPSQSYRQFDLDSLNGLGRKVSDLPSEAGAAPPRVLPHLGHWHRQTVIQHLVYEEAQSHWRRPAEDPCPSALAWAARHS